MFSIFKKKKEQPKYLKVIIDTISNPAGPQILMKQTDQVTSEELAIHSVESGGLPKKVLGQTIVILPLPVQRWDFVLCPGNETLRQLRLDEKNWIYSIPL
jgi:hypothetical protein